MRYRLEKIDIIDPAADSCVWEKANIGEVGVNRWAEYAKAPATTFKMLRGPEGISVLMHTEERGLRAECEIQNGDVYTDSCMELFIKPDNHDERYLNFEFNPKGVLHLGIGSGRHGRELIDLGRDIFSIYSDAKEGDWTLKFYIPNSFLLERFGKISRVFKGNVFKCGDMTDHVHYATWSEVEVDSPDYHVPDFFGIFEM